MPLQSAVFRYDIVKILVHDVFSIKKLKRLRIFLPKNRSLRQQKTSYYSDIHIIKDTKYNKRIIKDTNVRELSEVWGL